MTALLMVTHLNMAIDSAAPQALPTHIDPVAHAYWRLCKLRQIASRYVTAGHYGWMLHLLCEEIARTADELAHATPITRRGVYIKASEAAMLLGDDTAGAPRASDLEMVKQVAAFFRGPFRLNGKWFWDLRGLIGEIEQGVGSRHGGVISLKQIWNGMLARYEPEEGAISQRLEPMTWDEAFTDDDYGNDNGAGEAELAPISTAARIKSVAEMQEIVKRDWS